MRNKRITRFFQILFFTLFTSLLFLSCENLFSNIDEASSKTTYPSVHFMANMQSQAENLAIGARSAIPLLELSDTENIHYFVKATATGKSTRFVHGMNSSLEVELDSDTTWNIICGIGKVSELTDPVTGAVTYDINDEDIYMTSSPDNKPEGIYVPALDPVINKTFVLLPASGGSGYLSLKVSAESNSGIELTSTTFNERVIFECSEISDFADKTEISFDSVTSEVLLKTKTDASIPSGQYNLVIKFKNSSGVLLYATSQTITIINKMTTKKWVSDGQVIGSDGVFKVTKPLVDNFLDTTLYVGVIPPLSEMTEVNTDNNNSGTAFEPLETISGAISKIATCGSSSKDYHIYVSGEITGNVTIDSSLNTKAASITIEGYTAPDSSGKPTAKLLGKPINNSDEDAALNIDSGIPVTVKNLWIKPKEAAPADKYTRGIYVGSSNSLTVDGVLISGFNSSEKDGAGICINNTNAQLKAVNSNITENISNGDGGGIYIYGDCTKNHIIENCKISENHASYGGGLSVEGAKLKIYRSSITDNYADKNIIWDGGGGICLNVNEANDKADVTLGSGCIIRENKAKDGGGISNYGGKLTIDGAQIINNHAVNEQPEDSPVDEGSGGGIYISEYGSLDIISGIISENTAQKIGGGIYVGEFQKESYVNITGGIIENNSALTRSNNRGLGGAIYLSGEIVDDEPFAFYLSGSASIPAGTSNTNDIYLGKADFQSTISLKSPLINHSQSSPLSITIPEESSTRGVALVKAIAPLTSLDACKNSFAIESDDWNLKLSSDKKELRLDSPIWVAGDGAKQCTGTPNGNGPGTKASPFNSIASACRLINNTNVEYTIKVDGTISGAQEIPSTATASSITIQGANGLIPAGQTNSGRPHDVLDGKGCNSSALTINSTANVTIKDLQIYNAINESGGNGGNICSGTTNTLTLSSGSYLWMSRVKQNNCGGGGVYKENGKLIIEEGAIINQTILNPQAGNQCFGAGLYLKKANLIMTGGLINAANNNNGGDGKGGGIYFDADGAAVSARISGGEIAVCAAKEGAGIYMKGGNLYMSGGTIRANKGESTSSCGGGIYVDNGANIYLYGTALIGNKDITTAPTTNTSRKANFADNGGGIYINKGKVWLGYKATDKPQKFEEVAEGVLGGIIGNYANAAGGGIYISPDNDNNYVYITDGQIAFNGANATDGRGGGIYISANAEYAVLTGGILKGNCAKNGGAICNDTSVGALNLSGSVYIPPMEGEGNNDIYLQTKPVNITGKLEPPTECTDGIVAAIRPATYSTDSLVLTISSTPNPATRLSQEVEKFAVVSNGSDHYYISGSEGKLKTGYLLTPQNIDTLIEILNSGSNGQTLSLVNCTASEFSTMKSKLQKSNLTKSIVLDMTDSGITSLNQKMFQINPYNNPINVKKVILPPGITSIPKEAFWNCSVTEEVVMPDSVTELAEDSFGNSGIKTITLSSNLQTIGDAAFYDCNSLEEITIPASVTELVPYSSGSGDSRNGASPFYGCSKLKSITVEAGNTKYESIDGVLIEKETHKIMIYPPMKDGTEYITPSGITGFWPNSFDEISKLKKLTLSDEVTAIPVYFTGNSIISLEELTIGTGCTSIGHHAISHYIDKLKKVDFLIKNGWKAGDTELNLQNLSDSTIIFYLRQVNSSGGYKDYDWIRNP